MPPTPRRTTSTESDDTLQQIINYLVAGALLLASAGGLYWWLKPEPVLPMEVTVTLNNRCELIDAAFMAASEPDGAKAHFDAGRATLKTRSDAKIFVKASDKYPAFRFESAKVEAARHVTITAQCAQGEKIDSTLESMRQQFKR
jgi:hypothetical protein